MAEEPPSSLSYPPLPSADDGAMPPPPPSGPPPSYDQSFTTKGDAGEEGDGNLGGGGFQTPSQPPAAPYPTQPPPPPQPSPHTSHPHSVPLNRPMPPHPQVVVQYVNPRPFGPRPLETTCPNCNSQIRTTTETQPGAMAWIIAGVLCVVGLWCCACIPCCVDSLDQVTHNCPRCKARLGIYKPYDL